MDMIDIVGCILLTWFLIGGISGLHLMWVTRKQYRTDLSSYFFGFSVGMVFGAFMFFAERMPGKKVSPK